MMHLIRRRALLVSGAAVLCALYALFTASCSGRSPQSVAASAPTRAAVAKVKRQRIGSSLSIAGEFLPYQEVEIHAKVAGYIRKINVDIGDHVHAGQELALLEVPELTAQVQGADAGIKRSQQDITATRHQEAQAEADHAALHAAAVRLNQASEVRPGLIAEQELDDVNAKDRASEARVEAAKAAVAGAEQQLEVSKASRTQVSAMSDYSHIVAPFDGVVTWRYSDTGALVQAGTSSSSAQPVVKVAQVNIMRLRVPVPESAVASIHSGETADVVVSATGEHFTGNVVRSTGSLDRATRTMQVEIDVPNSQYKLSPGMYAQVTLHTDQLPNAVVIPVLAVHRNGEKTSVLLVNRDNRVEERSIQTGVEDPNFVQVTVGLKEGERVIVGSGNAYQPGELVSPRESSVSTVLASDPQGGTE
jgi:RND family efflux transporter MFP subunit